MTSTIRISCSERGVASIALRGSKKSSSMHEGRDLQKVCADQLDEYFSGKRKVFSVPLEVSGTPFQKAVWKAIAKIPYGETRSYAEIARMIGRPKAVRAVGQAVGANPVAILVPCHRVVSSPGSKNPLGGFAWGMAWKKKLLALETKK